MSVMADAVRLPITVVFDLFSEDVSMTQNAVTQTVRMSVRSMKADELFGSAAQGDRLGVVKAEEFNAKFSVPPQRYSTVITTDGRYTVQEWRPAPGVGVAIFYRLVLRGGSQ